MAEDRNSDLEEKRVDSEARQNGFRKVREGREKKEEEGPVVLKVPVSAIMLACAKYTHLEVRYGNSLWVLKLNSTKLKQE